MVEIQYGTVRGQYRWLQGPSDVPATGSIIFVPVEPDEIVDGDTVYARKKVTAALNDEGWVHVPGSAGTEVTLPAGRWAATLNIDGMDGEQFPFDVPAGGDVSLPEMAPLKPGPMERFIVNEFVMVQTLGARDEALAFRNEAEQFAEDAQAPANEVVDARIDMKRGAAGGLAPLGPDSKLPEAQVPDRLSAPALLSTFAPVSVKETVENGRLSDASVTTKIVDLVPSIANVKVNPLEGVAFVNYGDSYGNGAQGADQASRPFNRLAKRHATADLAVRSVAGTRMDQIAAAILSSWTPNSRGLVGFSDGVINDLKQYANDTGRTTTREAFRTCLALLTAKAVNTPGSPAIAFDANWSGGVTTTQGAFGRVAVNAPRCYLILGFYAGAARTVTIQNGSTGLATVNTGGYANDFPGVVEITGLTGTTELTVTATSGGARIYGVVIPSAYPPVIVWDKPGRYSSNNAEATRLALYLAECASILGSFPSVVPVDMGAGWDYTKMIAADATHRNDWGNIYATDRIDAELTTFLGGQPRQGLNRLLLANSETGADVTYAVPTATPIIVINTYAADDFNRADSASLGSTPTGAFAWQPINTGVWSIANNQLAASSGVAPTAPNDVLIDDGQANGTIQYTVKQLTSSGCAFRVSGTGNVNGYIVWSNGTTLTLSKRTGANAYTALGTGGTVAVNDVIKIVLNGSSIRVFKNNVEVITVTDSSYTGTKHGFWSNGTGAGAQAALFDAFSHDDRTS